MNLRELNAHVEQVRRDLNTKKDDLDRLLFADPATGMMVRYQIECLEPRLRELERQALRMTKEADARSVAA